MTDSVPPASVPDGWRKFNWRLLPMWSVGIGLPRQVREARKAAGQDVAKMFTTPCLIDTGTSHTFATRALFQRLQAVPTGERIHAGGAAGHEGIYENYEADLLLPLTVGGPPIMLRDLPISEGALSWPPGHPPLYDLVIGTDVLRFCRFTIDGPAGLFKLEATQ